MTQSQLSFTPTVISDITDEMDLAHEEIFGPIAPIMTFEDEKEVIHRANDTIYGLAAYFIPKTMLVLGVFQRH